VPHLGLGKKLKMERKESGDSGDIDHLIPEQIDHFFRLKKTR